MRNAISMLSIVSFVVLASTPPAALAQYTAAEVVASLSPGQQVRVQARGVSVELGTVSEIDGSTLYLTDAGQEWIIDASSIKRLEVRQRPVVQNVLVYGLIGALVGWTGDKFKEGGPDDGNGDGTLLGAAAGTAFGIGFGLTHWRWTVRFPR